MCYSDLADVSPRYPQHIHCVWGFLSLLTITSYGNFTGNAVTKKMNKCSQNAIVTIILYL